MSILSKCNYCKLEAMKKRAAKRGVTLVTYKDEFGWIAAKYSDHREPTSYFCEVTDKCTCAG